MLADVFSVSVLTGEDPTVTCSGEFDMAVADRFREAVDEVLATAPARVHFDCSGITFIDSLGSERSCTRTRAAARRASR